MTCIEGFLSSRRFWWLVRLATSIILLGLLFRSISFIDFWGTLQEVDFGWLLLGIMIYFPIQLLAAYRWNLLLRRMHRDLSYRSVLRHNLRGQFAALFLPGQISGDLVRTVSVSKGQSGKLTLTMSVIIDKAFLLAAIALIAVIGGLGSVTLSQITGLNLIMLVILAGTLVAIFLICRYRGVWIRQAFDHTDRFMPSVVRKHRQQIESIRQIPPLTYTLMGTLFVLALGLQAMNTLGSMTVARAMNIVVNPVEWAAINSVVALVQALPVSFGGLGIREGVFAGILLLYGIPVGQSTAYSLIGFVLVAVLASLSWFTVEFVHWRTNA